MFDENNILNLDYQGLDEKETYQKDEQEIQNQHEYYSQKRFLTKKRMRNEIEKEIEIQKRQEKYSLPKYFDINFGVNESDNLNNHNNNDKHYDSSTEIAEPLHSSEGNDLVLKRPVPNPIPFEPPPEVFAFLMRTHKKSHNVEKSDKEFEIWKKKITQLKLKMMKKEDENIIKKNHLEKIMNQNLVMDLAEEDFKNYFINDYEKICDSYKNLPSVYKKKEYPKTLDDIRMLKEYFDKIKMRINEEKYIKSNLNDLENNATTLQPNQCKSFTTNKSIIDNRKIADNFAADSKKPSQIQLTCMTRDEWVKNLMPSKKSHKQNHIQKSLVHINNCCSPNDENFILFKAYSCTDKKKIVESPIKSQYYNSKIKTQTNSNVKIPNIQKPKSIQIKKFNLSGYLFGTTRKNLNTANKDERNKQNIVENNVLEKQKIAEHQKLIKRMEALGKATEKSNATIVATDTNTQTDTCSTASDWIPSADDNYNGLGLIKNPTQTNNYARHKKHKISLNLLENNLQRKSSTSTIRYPFDKPLMCPVKSDIIISPNLQTEKTNFTKIFNARHHHHHRNAQHKNVFVKYLPKIPKY